MMDDKKLFFMTLFQKKLFSDTMRFLPGTVLFLFYALVTCGCNEAAPPLPKERAELVARFFRSIQTKDVKAAMRQGVKLRSLDKYNENIIRLVEIQQCNAYISSAQKMANAGNISGAIAVLQKGVREYPDNLTLRETLPKLRQLRNAKSLLNGMRRASNSIAMRSALTAAKIGLSANMTPALERYFANYEKQIILTEKKEQAEAEAQKKALLKKAEAEKKLLQKKTKAAPKKKADPVKAETTAPRSVLPKEPVIKPEKESAVTPPKAAQVSEVSPKANKK